MVTIRRAEEADFDAIWRIFREVVRRGDTYTYEPETTREQAHSIWMSGGHATYVACVDGRVVGMYILKPNHPGLGSHVANAGYMVSADGRGKGVGSAMCEHSLEEARRMGFLAMQFNIVVSTKDRKSTRLNSSHANISYAVFCLKKKKKIINSLARS